MQISFMDKQLIDIYNLKNIESIDINDMILSNYKSTKSLIVPALMVIYDGGKIINLCSRDDYFDTFVRKVVEVYHDEADNIHEDSLTDPFGKHKRISIDEHTKDILESGILFDKNKIYEFYKYKESYSSSLLNNKDNFNLLLPIVKYHLQELLNYMGILIDYNDTFTGYRNKFVIFSKVNNVTNKIFINYEKIDDNIFKFDINGLLDNTSISITISFKNDRIEITSNIDRFDLIYKTTYLITNGVVKKIDDVIRDNKNIYYRNNDLEMCSVDEKISSNNYSWYKLPWNAYYGINNSIINLSDTEAIVEIASMYLYNDNDSLYAKEYYSRSYKRKETSRIAGETVILDNIIKDIKGIYISNKHAYLMETTFLDTLYSSGYYNEFLENKYFYHLSKNIDINAIERDNLVYISSKDNVFEYADIITNDYILKRVRGN